MTHPETGQVGLQRRENAKRIGYWMLMAAPWITFGPITGLMSNRAQACFRRGERLLGALWVLGNVTTLVGIAVLVAQLGLKQHSPGALPTPAG